MQTVYWSPWYPDTSYSSLHLLYEKPELLLDEIKDRKNKDNRTDNWVQCHAMLNHVKNTFVLRFPFEVNFAIHKEFGAVPIDKTSPLDFVAIKGPSLNNSYTFSILNNWIFWSDSPLQITSTPAYLHKPAFDGYYVPGSFNINSWFRPLEAAIQLHELVEVVNIEKNEPFAYVKFHTEEQVVLKRFNFTAELSALSNACIQYKRYDKNRGLSFLYERFKKHGLDKAISKSIHENIME